MFTGTAEDLNAALQRMLQEDALAESTARYIELTGANNKQERAQLEKERRDAIKWTIPLNRDITQQGVEMQMLKDGLDNAQSRELNYGNAVLGGMSGLENAVNNVRTGFDLRNFRGITA